MKITQVMTQDVITCHANDTLALAAAKMWDADIGCLPVLNETDQVVGMITDRDICMAAYTQNRPLLEIPVFSAMSHEVFYCSPEEDVTDAETKMRIRQLHRLPVLNTEMKLVGIVSLNDLALEEERETSRTPQDISAQEVVSTLAAISHGRYETREIESQ